MSPNYSNARRQGAKIAHNTEAIDFDNFLRADAVSIDPAKLEQDSASPYQLVSLSKIASDPHQPRKEFKKEELKELVDTIVTHGVLQPILLRPIPTWNKQLPQVHAIITGERRWRAAQMAGVEVVPALIRDVSDKVALELQMIENNTRSGLTPEEQAHAYRRMMVDYGYTLTQIATRVGKSKATISRTMGVFKDPDLAIAVERGDITVAAASEILVGANRARMGLVPGSSASKVTRDLIEEVSNSAKAGKPLTQKEVRNAVDAKSGGQRVTVTPTAGITVSRTKAPSQQLVMEAASADKLLAELQRFSAFAEHQRDTMGQADYDIDEVKKIRSFAFTIAGLMNEVGETCDSRIEATAKLKSA